MPTKLISSFVLALLATLPLCAQTTAPDINHSAVMVALRNQNILFRAKVTPSSKPIESVTLRYAVSRDAAPFKVPMTSAGGGIYTGTVSAEMTSGLQQLLYYIEARDTQGAVAETPWYTVEIKAGTPTPDNAATTAGAAPSSTKGQSSWKKPALIAGGALAVGGAALAIMAGGGGGGDSGGGGGVTTNAAGTYTGTASVFFQPPSGSPSGSTYAISITITANGTVVSDTLYENTHLEGQMSGSSFTLTAAVNQGRRIGEIQFSGVVVDRRITGTVQGTATTPDGPGTYSGGFSASR